MSDIDLEKRIEAVEQRNKRVESDKAWERSWLRIACICILTYGIVLLYSYLAGAKSSIFLSSAVPVIGFFLSTLSVGLVRKLWDKIKNKKKKQ